MRKKIIAGNWKMFKTLQESESFCNEFKNLLSIEDLDHKQVILFPPYPFISTLKNSFANENHIFIGAQNCHHEEEGAFTGEVSARMIKSLSATHVVLGHSERRAYQKEDHIQLLKKTQIALNQNLTVIYCCGEQLGDRKTQEHLNVIENQIVNVINQLNKEQLKNIVVAYEPVWAIGTGETASPEQAQEMHAHIRQIISKQFGNEIAMDISILYGGSVKPSNAAELFSEPDIDGSLVGGASLKPTEFLAIIKAMP